MSISLAPCITSTSTISQINRQRFSDNLGKNLFWLPAELLVDIVNRILDRNREIPQTLAAVQHYLTIKSIVLLRGDLTESHFYTKSLLNERMDLHEVFSMLTINTGLGIHLNSMNHRINWLELFKYNLIEIIQNYLEFPMQLAALNGDVKYTDKNNTHFKSVHGLTLLHIAVGCGQLEFAKKLLTIEPKLLYEEDDEGRMPIHWAAYCGHMHILEELFKREPSLINQEDRKGAKPIHYAAAGGTIQFLEGNEVIYLGDGEDQTSIHYASSKDQLGCVNFLLSHDKHLLHLPDQLGRKPIHLAALHGAINCLERFIEIEPKLVHENDKSGKKPIHWAALKGHTHVVRALLKRDASLIDTRDNEDWSPLDFACVNGHLSLVKMFIEKNAPLKSKSHTSMHFSASEGHEEIVGELFEADRSLINISHAFGTPLEIALNKKHLNIVRKFLTLDPSISNLSVWGGTLLHATALSQDPNLLGEFIQINPQLITRQHSLDGETILHRLARYFDWKGGRIKCIKMLIEKEPSLIHIKNNKGEIPFDLAKNWDHGTFLLWPHSSTMKKVALAAISLAGAMWLSQYIVE